MNRSTEIATPRRIPKWVWVIALLLASIEPLQHAWIVHAPPRGTESTGMHVADSAIFIHAMRMFETDFLNPYASEDASYGDHSPRYFPVPFLWIYGALGIVARLLGLTEMTALGLANGIGTLFFLLAAYSFLRQAVPRQADLAFLLYAFCGGLGGMVYAIATASGVTQQAEYEPYLLRYFLYELMEGPAVSPVLFAPRLYYTLALGCALSALAFLCRWARQGGTRWFLAAILLEGAATLINLRIGAMALGVALLFLMGQSHIPPSRRFRAACGLTVSLLVPLAFVWALLQTFPLFSQNVWTIVRGALWVSPFLTASCFHFCLVLGIVWSDLRTFPRLWRIAAGGLCGYLLAFGVVWTAHQAYYGVLLRSADSQAAIWASDPALLGALAGALLGGYLPRNPGTGTRRDAHNQTEPWLVIWLLLYLAVAISAFGQGLFLRLTPQRAVIFIGLPLSILAAKQLQRLKPARPGLTRGLVAVMVSCGACSILVAALFFQGPLGYRSGTGSFAWVHMEVMTQEDATCLGVLGDGRVLAPHQRPFFSDIATVNGNQSLGGQGAINYATESLPALTKEIAHFFGPNTTVEERETFARKKGLKWIYCPHVPPVDEETRRQLRKTEWLRETAQAGNAILFQVVERPTTNSDR